MLHAFLVIFGGLDLAGAGLMYAFPDIGPRWIGIIMFAVGLFTICAGFETVWRTVFPTVSDNAVQRLRLCMLVVSALFVFSFVTAYYQTTLSGPTIKSPPPSIPRPPITNAKPSGVIAFDYSTYSGVLKFGDGDCEFHLKFSRRGRNSVYMYNSRHDRRTNVARFARIKPGDLKPLLRFQDFDSTSDSRPIQTGDHFMAQNSRGCFVLGRVLGIMNAERGAPKDLIAFKYRINTHGSSEFAPLEK